MVRAPALLRWSFIVGAVVDGLFAVLMAAPPRYIGRVFGLEAFDPGAAFRYSSAVGAALMAGWTLLLLWALRAPVERRGVLLVTIVAVLGLMGANAYAVAAGVVAAAAMAPTFVMQAGLIGLFAAGYRSAARG